jgi:tRNA-splicing ligase RtcB
VRRTSGADLDRAMPARDGEGGVLPSSMGTTSFHVEGRGCADALCSSAHGAGRVLSRTAARRKVTEAVLRRQMRGIWFDHRLSDKLRDEAPAACKDIRAVLRAQHELVKVTRVLRPILNYQGGMPPGCTRTFVRVEKRWRFLRRRTQHCRAVAEEREE